MITGRKRLMVRILYTIIMFAILFGPLYLYGRRNVEALDKMIQSRIYDQDFFWGVVTIMFILLGFFGLGMYLVWFRFWEYPVYAVRKKG
ncbi:MAG: hypothetical protein ABIH38_05325 [Patescibacteria group bacterium]